LETSRGDVDLIVNNLRLLWISLWITYHYRRLALWISLILCNSVAEDSPEQNT
jgi:hypothetical protein